MSDQQRNHNGNGEDLAGQLARLAADPLMFIKLCWPDMMLSDKQRQIILSVQDNIETFVHAANKVGKTRVAALLAIWWFASRSPARVVVSSSSEAQLKSGLWREIRFLIGKSAYPLPFRITSSTIEKLTNPETQEVEPLDFIIAHVTNEVENFQGHHLGTDDRPRVLVIIDEASGVPDGFFEAAGSWAHHLLAIGNPLSTTNVFYQRCKAGDVADPAGQANLLRKVIHVDGLDSPNVQAGFRWKAEGREGQPPVLVPGLLTYQEYVRRNQDWDEVQKTTRLHGLFYEGELALLFPMTWLDAAMDSDRWDELQCQDRRAAAIGLDVAAGGGDLTCWTVVDRFGVIEQIVLDTPDSMMICGLTIELLEQYNLAAENVAIDSDGGGKQIADRLREQGHYVEDIGFGAGAEANQAYKNRRAEMYARLRAELHPNHPDGTFALPPDAHELQQELAALPLQYDSEGRLILPPKAELRRLLRRSPDRADSLALAVWALLHGDYPFGDDDRVAWGPGDFPPDPTKEELETWDPYYRGIYEMYETRDEWDDWDDWDDEPRGPYHGHDMNQAINDIAFGLSAWYNSW